MDRIVTIIFPNQLFEPSECRLHGKAILIEEYLFFRQFSFHKQKITYHRASMKWYESELKSAGYLTQYVHSFQEESDIKQLIKALAKDGVSVIHVTDPIDDWLMQRITSEVRQQKLDLVIHNSPMFINSMDTNLQLLGKVPKFNQSSFYIHQRKLMNILVDKKEKPIGGKWSFDSENRKRYPKDKIPPKVTSPASDKYHYEATKYVNEFFSTNPGEVSEVPLYPYTRNSAKKWLHEFLNKRFKEFGTYEDAMVKGELILHHSVLTPMLNTGLLTPTEVINEAIAFSKEHEIPLNSLEGFIRQITGWREFIRAVYELKGRKQRNTNFWKFNRKIPSSFYTGETGIVPVDEVISKVLKHGYCHHIERLMVLGSFMLLCEFDPDEVYKWFMELFIDAYDWVMVPNVYGMSQFADGGLMSTKPYICGSNYIMKMSNHEKGDWQIIWDGLYWRFIHTHRDVFAGNHRTSMAVNTYNKMNDSRKKDIKDAAEGFLNSL